MYRLLSCDLRMKSSVTFLRLLTWGMSWGKKGEMKDCVCGSLILWRLKNPFPSLRDRFVSFWVLLCNPFTSSSFPAQVCLSLFLWEYHVFRFLSCLRCLRESSFLSFSFEFFFQDFWEKAFHRELCVLRKRKGIRRIQDQKEIESEEEESTKRGFSSLKEIRKLDSSFHPLRFDLVSWSSLKNFVVFMLLSSSYVWYWCAVLRDTLSVGGLLGIKWQFESYKGFGDASFHWILCFFLLLDSKGLDKDWRHWFSWLSIRVEDTGTILSLLLLVRVLLSWLKLLRDEKL